MANAADDLRLIVYSFSSRSPIFHFNGDVTIAASSQTTVYESGLPPSTRGCLMFSSFDLMNYA
jgi:hypothetical protein